MGRKKTPSFVLNLKLNTNFRDDKELNDRFFAVFLMKNKLIKHAKKRIQGMRQDKQYRALMTEYQQYKGVDTPEAKKARNRISEQLSEIRKAYGLSEFQFHEWIAVQKNMCNGIDINTAQKVASTVWRAVEDVLFKKGKAIHFCKFDQLSSVEGKNNTTGIRFKDGKLYWFDLCIKPQIRKNDTYAREALTHNIKYCRIVRKPMGTTYHYYLQLVLEGIPPQKHKFLTSGNVGIDQGTSTEAVVSEKGCILTELSAERKDISKEVTRIQRRMDRSMRANNPDNYKPDGTVKRGKKFKKSKTYRKDQMRIKTLCRRVADASKQSEERLSNEILCNHGSDIFTEHMNYKALQKRSTAETTVSEKTGRCKSKRRFGASIGKHAPARFMNTLNRKLGYMGKAVVEVDTTAYKASQYNHVTDSYEKHELNERSKLIGKFLVQRDLYSAFLLMCASSGQDKPDLVTCKKLFKKFLKHQNETLITLLTSDTIYPSCMGLNDFRHLLTNVK